MDSSAISPTASRSGRCSTASCRRRPRGACLPAPDLRVRHAIGCQAITASPGGTRRWLVAALREGVCECWFVDLDADRAEIYRLIEGRYGQPELVGAGGVSAVIGSPRG